MGERVIYLDCAAATPLDERVFDVMRPYLTTEFYNPSSSYQAARHVRADYEAARHRLAMALGAKQHEIILTAGSTESINLAVHGIIGQYGGRVAASGIEHAAVLAAATRHQHDTIAVDSRGYVTPEAVQRAIAPDTSLVCVGYANNELGTVQPRRDIAAVVERERQQRLAAGNLHPIFLHSDASQAVGLLDISVARLGVDLMTIGAGKCYGPKQVGLLWLRAGLRLQPLINGGGQENNLRSGTENVAGVIGFAEAVAIAVATRKQESYRLGQLRDRLWANLERAVPGIVRNGHPKRHVPHILHVSIPDLDGERAVFALDERGVLLATGSACAANSGTRSHVLAAIGMSDDLADGSLRCSVGRMTTEVDIDEAAHRMIEVITKERGR